jgi:HK97 family phage prohead protease
MNYHQYQAELRARVKQINKTYPHESLPSKVLQGLACIYDVIHSHKGRKEMFAKGCFDDSLFGVMFLIDHNVLSENLGDQDDNNLELIDGEIGLAFRLTLARDHLDKLGGRDEMSVSYQERDVEYRAIDGETVRVVKSATLIEISAVYVGAIRKTYAVVRDANSVGNLADDAKGFAYEAAGIAFQRALRNLQTAS